MLTAAKLPRHSSSGVFIWWHCDEPTDTYDRLVQNWVECRIQFLHDILQEHWHAELYRMFKYPHVVRHLEVDDFQALEIIQSNTKKTAQELVDKYIVC